MPVRSGKLLVTDPCYERCLRGRLWCNAVVEDVLPHEAYQVRHCFEKYNFVSLSVYHPDYINAIPDEIAHDDIGVDSATISLSDVEHKFPLSGLHGHSEVVDWHGSKVAAVTCDDGGYILLVARNEEDKIVAVEVLDPPLEENEEEE